MGHWNDWVYFGINVEGKNRTASQRGNFQGADPAWISAILGFDGCDQWIGAGFAQQKWEKNLEASTQFPRGSSFGGKTKPEKLRESIMENRSTDQSNCALRQGPGSRTTQNQANEDFCNPCSPWGKVTHRKHTWTYVYII